MREMHRILAVAVYVVFLVIVPAAYSGVETEIKGAIKAESSELLPSGETSHSVIAVDGDNVIRQYFRLEREGVPASPWRESLVAGQRILRSGDIELSKVLPSTVIPVSAATVTLGNMRLHAVLSWGFESTTRNDLYYQLHLLRENLRTGAVSIIHNEKNLSSELDALIFRDVNGDGVPELIDIGQDNAVSTARIRRIRNGEPVERIQELTGNEIRPLADDTDPENLIFIAIENKLPVEGALRCYTTEEFRWSAKAGRYLPAEAAERK